jgi:putative hydrolase of the HAD superfamily
MNLRHILFDLDDTLYRSSSGMFPEIRRRMTTFVARFFGLSREKAFRKRQEFVDRYGTTLGGLLESGALTDPELFLEEVHPENVGSFIAPDPGLRPALLSIDCPKSVFTNSPREHAERILDFFGIRDCFREIYDIRFSGFQGKPRADAYRRVLEAVGEPPERVLLVDDSTAYLRAFYNLGGRVLQIREDGVPTGEWPCLKGIKDLPRFLTSAGGCCSDRPSGH